MEKIEIESLFGSKIRFIIDRNEPDVVTLLINEESGYIIPKKELEKLYKFIK
jgi:hypothetical protein